MVTFRDEAQLRSFLEELGDYGKYAAALWSAELRTSDQLANAVDDALKPHVAFMHIGDLRVKAKQYQPGMPSLVTGLVSKALGSCPFLLMQKVAHDEGNPAKDYRIRKRSCILLVEQLLHVADLLDSTKA